MLSTSKNAAAVGSAPGRLGGLGPPLPGTHLPAQILRASRWVAVVLTSVTSVSAFCADGRVAAGSVRSRVVSFDSCSEENVLRMRNGSGLCVWR